MNKCILEDVNKLQLEYIQNIISQRLADDYTISNADALISQLFQQLSQLSSFNIVNSNYLIDNTDDILDTMIINHELSSIIIKPTENYINTKTSKLFQSIDFNSITSITIDNSVSIIYDSCFKSCINLKSLTLPANLIKINHELCKDCHNLISVNIPDNVEIIEDDAFKNCYSLSTINLNNIKLIYDDAFLYSSLSNIIIPSTVIYLGNSFRLCKHLQYINISENIMYICKHAFNGTNLSLIANEQFLTNKFKLAFKKFIGLKYFYLN